MLFLLYPRERPGTHCTGGWVDLRVGLNSMEKLTSTRIGSLDSPAHSEALYQSHHSVWRYGFILLESWDTYLIDVFLCYKCLHRYLF